MPNKLLFIDDHAAIFDSLITVVKDQFSDVEVNVFDNASLALEHLLTGEIYDLILLDLDMPTMSGYEFIKQLNGNGIYIPTAILSGYISSEKLIEIKELGAVGFIPKTSDTRGFLKAIKTVLEGEFYFSEQLIAEHEANIQATRTATAEKLHISTRQLQVLECIAKGLSNQAIADSLFISLDTVKSHIKSLYQSLDAKNRVECAQHALKYGLID